MGIPKNPYEQLREILLQDVFANANQLQNNLETQNESLQSAQQKFDEFNKACTLKFKEIEAAFTNSEKNLNALNQNLNIENEALKKKLLELNLTHQEFKQQVVEANELFSDFKNQIESEAEFRAKINPFINDKIDELKQNFNTIFGDEMKTSFAIQLEESQDTFINALYPIIGKLIKKFVAAEVNKLQNNIAEQIENRFSAKAIKTKFKSIFSGVKEEHLEISNALSAIIEQSFVIQHNSGLLIASYSKGKVDNEDMFAGMLTAIKQFAENVTTNVENEELETIDYGTNKVLLSNYPSYYIANIVSGTVANNYIDAIKNLNDNFSKKYMAKKITNIDNLINENISSKLKMTINEFEKNYN